jgi:hypothetical protein
LADFTDAQGNAIPEDQLADAFARGEAFGDTEAQYRMRNATGDVVQVRGAEVPKALAAGASLLSPSESAFEERRPEYEGTGAAVRTMLERGASTASGGLTDLAVGLSSPEAARGMRERATVQQDAAEFGSALGMAVPLSVGGKLAAPVSKLAALAKPTTPIGRMALRAASEAAPYALEGALYGGTSTAGSLALNQQEITAEKVLSGAGQGALLGGLFGLGSQAAARGARKIAGKLDEFAEGLGKRGAAENGRSIDALKPSQRLIKQKVGRDSSKIESALDEVNRDYLGYKIKTGPMKGKTIHHGARDPVDVIDDVTHAWNETGREIQRFRDAADELGRAAPEARPDAVTLNKKLDDVVTEVAGDEFAGAAQKKLARKIERDHLKPLREWRERGASDPIEQLQALGVENLSSRGRDRVANIGDLDALNEVRGAYQGATPEIAEAISTGKAQTPKGKAFEPIKVRLDSPAGPVIEDGWKRVAAAQQAGAENVLATVVKPDGSEWTGTISIKGRPITPDGAPSLSQLDRMRQSVGDQLSAAKRAGQKGAIRAYGKVYSAITESIDETIERTLAPQGVNLAEYKELKRVYSSLSFAKNAIDELRFAQAAGRGAKPASAADNAGIAYAFAQALTGNFGNAAHTVAQSVLGNSVAGALSGRAANATTALQLGAKALATGSRAVAKAAPYVPSAAVRYMMRAEPQVVFDRLRDTAADPVKLQQYAANRVQDFAQQYPDLAVAAQQLIVGDLQHLAQTAPQGFTRHAAGLTPMSKEARERLYSHPDVKKWLERAEALENPASVVNAMLEGRVPYDAIETLKLRRPQLYQEIRMNVATEIAQQPDLVPFRRRVMLGTALEFPADYSMLPEVAAELQAPPMADEGGQQGGVTQAATPDTSMMLTSTDRLEERM